jgi:hypothetical protein
MVGSNGEINTMQRVQVIENKVDEFKIFKTFVKYICIVMVYALGL